MSHEKFPFLLTGLALAGAAAALWLTSYYMVVPQVVSMAAAVFILIGIARRYTESRHRRRYHH